MRILYHHRTQAEDAQGVHIYEMVNAFRELGHEVSLVALVEKDVESDEKTKGAGWQRIADAVPNWIYELLELVYNVVGFLNIAARIRSFRPDFIYERYSLNTFCGVWASKIFRIPILLEVNAPLYFEQKKLGKLAFERFARFSERWICSNSSTTIVVTQVMKELFVEMGVPESKLTVMHNGVNPARFKQEGRDSLRKKLGLNERIVIGFVGWFREWHGLDMLVRLFHESDFATQGAALLFVGDGPASDELNTYIDEHSLHRDVHITGAVNKNEVADYIAAFDIAVQPRATAYACPMKVIEYMIMGKCIIAPDQPNISELLQQNFSGLLFNIDDEQDFAAKLSVAVKDNNLRRTIGDQAEKEISRQGLMWIENARRSVNLLQRTR